MGKIKFTKMHGTGNDYIYFNCMEQELPHPEELSVRLSHRHFGIGGDGIVFICRSNTADAKMHMFNADGSEGKMCGNAIRCVGKYLYERGLVKKEELSVETLSGIKLLKLAVSDGIVQSVTVDMGKPLLEPAAIPVRLAGDKVIGVRVPIGTEEYAISCVSMGNPHCVVYVADPYQVELEKIGPVFEYNDLFPERVNTEFVAVSGRNDLVMRVWERGSGETWACGTGACAAAVASVENGFCDKNTDITVRLRGGDLKIKYTDETVYLTGGATFVFEGEVCL